MIVDQRVKVAVATSDGINCNLHFGKTEEVAVYALHDDGEIRLEGKRAFPSKEAFLESEGGRLPCKK